MIAASELDPIASALPSNDAFNFSRVRSEAGIFSIGLLNLVDGLSRERAPQPNLRQVFDFTSPDDVNPQILAPAMEKPC